MGQNTSRQPFLPLLPGGIEYEHSLGSGRFIKTIRASQAGQRVVVKVYVKPAQMTADSSRGISKVLSEIRQQADMLSTCSNCFLSWQIVESDRAVLLIRPFFMYNLYDRMYSPA